MGWMLDRPGDGRSPSERTPQPGEDGFRPATELDAWKHMALTLQRQKDQSCVTEHELTDGSTLRTVWDASGPSLVLVRQDRIVGQARTVDTARLAGVVERLDNGLALADWYEVRAAYDALLEALAGEGEDG